VRRRHEARAEVGGLSLIPDQPTLENYRLMWARAPFGRAIINSLFVATTITVSVLVFGSAAAYALARLEFPGRAVLNTVTVVVLLVPAQLTLIPTYTLIVELGWIDSYAALIAPYAFNAMAILILRQFFLQVDGRAAHPVHRLLAPGEGAARNGRDPHVHGGMERGAVAAAGRAG
jgi:multiple sugar transport system permease protein